MPKLTDHQQAQRRRHLLDAAERCFARDGFHRTTMQRICTEAGVSPGALYLYFPSKESLIAGIAERDRHDLAEGFAAVEHAADPFEALHRLARHHFVDEPQGGCTMALQIWAEATRDPAVAELCRTIEHEVRRHLARVVSRLPGAGSRFDVDTTVDLIGLVADGMFKQRAMDPDFDAEGGVAMLMGLLRAAMAGELGMLAPVRPTDQPIPTTPVVPMESAA